jgi:hypothetical protein
MPEPKLIIKKLPRGEYEIGTYTQDGAIVARISLRDDKGTKPSVDDQEHEALERAKRLGLVLQQVLSRSPSGS